MERNELLDLTLSSTISISNLAIRWGKYDRLKRVTLKLSTDGSTVITAVAGHGAELAIVGLGLRAHRAERRVRRLEAEVRRLKESLVRGAPQDTGWGSHAHLRLLGAGVCDDHVDPLRYFQQLNGNRAVE